MIKYLKLFFLIITYSYSQLPDTLLHYVSQNNAINQHYKTYSTPDGELITLWESLKENSLYTTIYANKITREGQLAWGRNGIAIAFTKANLKNPTVISYKGNSFTVIYEQRNNSNKIVLQEILANGNLLYGDSGKVLIDSLPKLHSYKAISFLNKYLYILVSYNKTLELHRIDLENFTTWEKPVILEKDKPLRKFYLLPSNNLGCIIVWECFDENKWQLKTQKILPNGRKSWNFAQPVSISSKYQSIEKPDIIYDGLGGIICAYEKNSTFNKAIYVVRINSVGKKVYDIMIAQNSNNPFNPKIIKVGSNAIITWQEEATGLFMKMINIKTGDLLTANSYNIIDTRFPIKSYSIAYNSLYNYFLITWNYNDKTYWGTFISYDEGISKLIDPFIIKHIYKKDYIQEFKTAADNYGNIWILYKTNKNAFVQNIDAHAFPLFEKDIPLHYKIKQRNLIQNLTRAKLSTGEVLLCWEYSGNGTEDIYIQKIDSSGKSVWRYDGIPAWTDTFKNKYPVIQPTKTGFFIVWIRKLSEKTNELYTMFYDNNGIKQWEKPLLLAKGKGARIAPTTIEIDNNLIVAWIDTRNIDETGFDIYIQSVFTGGNIKWDIYGKPLIKFQGYQTEPELLKLSDNHFLLSWMDDRNGYYQIYYQFYDKNAMPLSFPWDGKRLWVTKGNQRNVDIELIGNNVLFAWSDAERGENITRIKFYPVNATNANPLLPEPVECAKTYSKQIMPEILPINDTNLLVLWEDSRNQKATGFNLYAQILDIETGNRLLNLAGKKMDEFLNPFAPYDAIKNNDKIYIAWERIVDKYRKTWMYLELNAKDLYFSAPRGIHISSSEQKYGNLVSIKSRVFFIWVQGNAILITSL